MALSCTQCGTPLPDDAAFCLKCGKPQQTGSAKSTPLPTSKTIQQWMNEGDSFLKANQLQEALSAFDEVIQQDYQHAQAYAGKALALEHMTRYQEALENYNSAIQLDPSNRAALYGKANVLKALGRGQELTGTAAQIGMPNMTQPSIPGQYSNTPGSSAMPTPSYIVVPAPFSRNIHPGTILILIGGIAGILSFFLPWISLFIFKFSLYDILSTTPQQVSQNVAFMWIEPLAASGLILCSLLEGRVGPNARAWSLFIALGGVVVVIIFFAQIQSSLSNANATTSPTSVLDIGFWIAAIAFITALVGAIMDRKKA